MSTGFDGLDNDAGNAKILVPPGGSEPVPVGGLDLTVEDFGWVTRKLQEVADMCCHGRMISVLEGGAGSLPGKATVKYGFVSVSFDVLTMMMWFDGNDRAWCFSE